MVAFHGVLTVALALTAAAAAEMAPAAQDGVIQMEVAAAKAPGGRCSCPRSGARRRAGPPT